MKKLHNILSVALIALLTTFTSCNNDSDAPDICEPAPLPAPQVTINDLTQTSMTVSWLAVDGARQYGYIITDINGEEITAGVTTATSIEVSDLAPTADYIVAVQAFPKTYGAAKASAMAKVPVQTLFYLPVENWNTEYVSKLQANVASVTNRGTINEDRSGDDYEEGWYGTFTITKFCGANNHDMVFKVNRDNTIKILNGEGYDEAGRVKLKTGKSSSATLSFDYIYIDESSAVFDGPNHKLTFSAKNNGTGTRLRESTTETITWTEPEE